jgi:hypothetical protein
VRLAVHSYGDGDNNSYGDGDNNSYGDGDNNSYGDGDNNSYIDGDNNSYGDGDNNSYIDGDNNSYGDGDKGTLNLSFQYSIQTNKTESYDSYPSGLPFSLSQFARELVWVTAVVWVW